MNKYFTIDLHIYPCCIDVYIGDCSTESGAITLDNLIPDNIKCKRPEWNIDWKGSCYNKYDGDSVLIFYYSDDRDKLISTIRHEVHHAANHIWEYIQDDNYNSEAFLYLNDYIFKQILKQI